MEGGTNSVKRINVDPRLLGRREYAVKLEMRKILETIFEVQVKQQKPFSSLFINHKKRTKYVLLIRW